MVSVERINGMSFGSRYAIESVRKKGCTDDSFCSSGLTIASLPMAANPPDTWNTATLLKLAFPSSGLLVILKLVEESVQCIFVLASHVVLKEIGGVHEEVNVDLEPIVKEERIFLRMSVYSELRVWEPCADLGISMSLDGLIGK